MNLRIKDIAIKTHSTKFTLHNAFPCESHPFHKTQTCQSIHNLKALVKHLRISWAFLCLFNEPYKQKQLVCNSNFDKFGYSRPTNDDHKWVSQMNLVSSWLSTSSMSMPSEFNSIVMNDECYHHPPMSIHQSCHHMSLQIFHHLNSSTPTYITIC